MSNINVTKVFFAGPRSRLTGVVTPLEKHEVFPMSINFLKNGTQPLMSITRLHREEGLLGLNSVYTECKGIEAFESECEEQDAQSRITDHTMTLFFSKKKRKNSKGE